MADDPPRKHPRAQTGTERDLQGMAALRVRTPVRGLPQFGIPPRPPGVPLHVEPDDEKTPLPVSIDELSKQPITHARTITQRKAVESIQAIPNVDQRVEALAISLASHGDALAYQRERQHKLEEHGESLAELRVLVERVLPMPHEVARTSQLVEQLRIEARDLNTSVLNLIRAQERDDVRREDGVKADERVLAEIAKVAIQCSQIQAAHSRTETNLSLLSQRVDTLGANHRDRLERLEARQTGAEVRINSIDTRHKISVALTRREKAGLAVGGLGAGGAGYGLIELIKLIASHFH